MSSPSAIAIIPARLASTRFPGKMLADRTGMPLIQHVVEQAKRAKTIREVLVAADDERILEAVRRYGTKGVMTRADHPNGTSRLAEAAAGMAGGGGMDIIVNVQGDEPEIEPALIDEAVRAFAESGCGVGTLATAFAEGESAADPNVVKVVLDGRSRALYFSRSWVPFDRDGAGLLRPLKHVGLYIFRREFLLKYPTLPMTDLERTEQLEQLRILYHGHPMHVHVTERATAGGIDTPAQYEAFAKRWEARGAT